MLIRGNCLGRRRSDKSFGLSGGDFRTDGLRFGGLHIVKFMAAAGLNYFEQWLHLAIVAGFKRGCAYPVPAGRDLLEETAAKPDDGETETSIRTGDTSAKYGIGLLDRAAR